MSFLDMYAGDQAEALRVKPNEAPNLPARFSDTFDAAWSENQLFGQSMAGENARNAALQDHIDGVKAKTGKDIAGGIDWTAAGFGGSFTADMLRDQVNAEAAKHGIPELSAEDLEQRAIDKSKAARTGYAELQDREKTLGGSVGMFLGGAASSATDPINLLALPIAPETGAVGILAAALRWGAVGAGAQAAIELAGGRYRDEVQPGYSESGQPLVNVAEAFGGGAVLGGGTKALGNLWTRLKSGAWPTSVRDAGNVIESEANVANTNVYQGVEGEVAHRAALSKTIDDLAAGRPVDVENIITPEIEAAREARYNEILMSREEAIAAQKEAQAERASMHLEENPDLPFEQTAKEAEMEGHLGDVAFGVQRIAQDAGYTMARDEADRIAARVANATDDDARRILDEVAMRPRTLADTLPKAERAPKDTADIIQPEARTALADQLTPDAIAKIAKEPELDETILRDLDRLRAGGIGPDDVRSEFQTAKGSMYQHFGDGTTARNKSFHPEHGAKDQGPQPRSERTFYVTSADAVKLGEFQTQGDRKAIAQSADGSFGVKYLTGDSAGKFERRTMVKPQPDPAIGLTPVEIWKDGERVHFGNEITSVTERRRGGDLEVAMGETINAAGERVAVTRKVEDVLAEADERIAAAKEIEACAGPYQEAAE